MPFFFFKLLKEKESFLYGIFYLSNWRRVMAKAHRKTDLGRLKDNRGTGELQSYIPWHTVVEVGSSGSSYRPFGIKTNRVHIFLSKIEYSYFLLCEWNDNVVDIREQFPLDINMTKNIAKNIGVKHSQNKGRPIFTTTDFLLTVKNGGEFSYLARAIKSESELSNPRTIEKLTTEREYWNQKGIDWKLITEKDLPKNLIKNIEILRPNYQRLDNGQIYKKIEHAILFYWNRYQINQTINVIKLCNEIDERLKLEIGTSLKVFKSMVYQKQIFIDLYTQIINFNVIKKENDYEPNT